MKLYSLKLNMYHVDNYLLRKGKKKLRLYMGLYLKNINSQACSVQLSILKHWSKYSRYIHSYNYKLNPNVKHMFYKYNLNSLVVKTGLPCLNFPYWHALEWNSLNSITDLHFTLMSRAHTLVTLFAMRNKFG